MNFLQLETWSLNKLNKNKAMAAPLCHLNKADEDVFNTLETEIQKQLDDIAETIEKIIDKRLNYNNINANQELPTYAAVTIKKNVQKKQINVLKLDREKQQLATS